VSQSRAIWAFSASMLSKAASSRMNSISSTSITWPYRSPSKSKKKGSSHSCGGSNIGRVPRLAAPFMTWPPGNRPRTA
jgi:hypothetical protein